MTYRSMITASALTVAGLGVAAALAAAHAPAGMQLPTHWDAAGIPNRFMGAPAALFIPVILCLALSLVMAIIPVIEPMQRRLEDSAGLYKTAWAGLLAMMALIEVQVAAPVFGIAMPGTLVLAGMGVLFILIGNMLPKSRPGYFVGIRTPWTLTDPDNWIATHRLGSRTMMIGGALIVIAAFLPIAAAERRIIVLCSIAIAVVPPLIYSFLYWKRAQTN